MMTIPFEQASYLTQVRRLREIAQDVIKQYPLKMQSIDFIKYSANAIFKITDVLHKKYMLRISPAHFRTKSAILEELEWLHCILETTTISVPKPMYTNEGEYLVEYQHPKIPDMRYCLLFEWVEGRHLWKAIDKKYAYRVGALTAQLEESGKRFKSQHRLYWDTEGLVGTEKARYVDLDHLTGVPNKQHEIIKKARRCAYAQLKHYENNHPEKLGLIHEDLNPNNIIVLKDKYQVIDFDDCGIGIYGYDLTEQLIAFEHLTENDKTKHFGLLKEALYQGYADHTPLTQDDIDIIPYFLLARKLIAIGSLVFVKDNPKMRPWFQKAIERAILFFQSNKME